VGRDTQIVFTKSIPSNSPGCRFEISVVSSGLSGQFYPGAGSSPQRQQDTVRGSVLLGTPKRLVTFIVHGLSDNQFSFWPLRNSLQTEWAGRPSRIVDAHFDFPECLSIKTGAQRLADHVGRFSFYPGDRIAFVAHSMGGLMVRRMLADGLLAVNVPVVGLVTLGTPHLGYPYLPGLDENFKCGVQVQEMESRLFDGNPLLQSGTMSPFLTELYTTWNPSQVGYRWFAAGGAFCDTRLRSWPSAISSVVNGCRRENPSSDGVVCLDSALVTYPQSEARMVPTERFSDPEKVYMHGNSVGWPVAANVLCGTPVPPFLASKRSLTNPLNNESLFDQIRSFLDAL
jgi:pimeloyl-ACP methyl ester carboxylesterase